MIIRPTDGTGITSCLSVRLSDACAYAREHLEWPTDIDSSKQFWWYKDVEGQDISPMYLAGYLQPPKNVISSYHHEWQWNWLDEVDFYSNSRLSNMVCPISDTVIQMAMELKPLIEGRHYVLYRGNDKAKEISPTPYETMVEMARKSGQDRFFVQTDDSDFLSYFMDRFPGTTYSDLIPRIPSNTDKYVMPVFNKAVFGQKFLSLLSGAQFADGLITTTGNTGIWAAFFRGTLENTYQHNGRKGMWRKVG